MNNLNIVELVNAVKCKLSGRDSHKYCQSCPYRLDVYDFQSCDIYRLIADIESLSKYYLDRLDLEKEIREDSSLDPEKYVKVGDIQECMSQIPMNSDEMIHVGGLITWAVGKRSISKDELKVELNRYTPPYTPVCPRGYTDCVGDPAYIKYHYPDWYKEMWGSRTPEDAASECRERMYKDPEERYHCYDNEDK